MFMRKPIAVVRGQIVTIQTHNSTPTSSNLCSSNPSWTRMYKRSLHPRTLGQKLIVRLSGGELQRVAICLVLGVPADVLLIDEPSAYLDSEQRIHASKVIKKFVMSTKRTAFIVEHDFVRRTSAQ